MRLLLNALLLSCFTITRAGHPIDTKSRKTLVIKFTQPIGDCGGATKSSTDVEHIELKSSIVILLATMLC